MKHLITIICLLLVAFKSNAQTAEALSPILFIYDASGSMWGELDGKTNKKWPESPIRLRLK